VVLCVPTPLTPNREPDLGPLLAATAALAAVLRAGQLVVLESTTFPGTTRELLAPRLEESGLRAGVDFNLAYSPERLDPGSVAHGLRTTPKLVAGLTPACTERARDLYLRVCDEVIALTSPDAAEFTKLLENVFRSVNIALVNELAVLADRMGIDIWEVVDAAATKPFGFMTFRPGPGMGGHCLPVDPFYLAWRAREFDVPCEFVELAGKVNQRMPQYCAERVQRALNDARRPVRDSRILLLGVAYKAGIADVRESPALKLLDTLTELGGDVAYHDDHVPELAGHGLRSRDLDEAVAWADAVVIVTAHPEVDHDDVARRARLLVDLRGVTRDVASPTVVKL
jgi:UDP-N-acetyl-D-glucosamine dehydrogenase